jgi:hypothetical protein
VRITLSETLRLESGSESVQSWTLYELRTLGAKSKTPGEKSWHAFRFYGSLYGGLLDVLDKKLLDKEGEADLRETISAIREAERSLLRAVDDAIKAVEDLPAPLRKTEQEKPDFDPREEFK